MYIIKVKGKAKIPDYIQIRDENFVLVAYFRADRPLKSVEKFGLEGNFASVSYLLFSDIFGTVGHGEWHDARGGSKWTEVMLRF